MTKRTTIKTHFIATIILVFYIVPLFAHDSPSHTIEAITRKIEQEPDNAQLYLKRGALHRICSHWDLALADFNRVAQLDPEHESIGFHRGRLLLEAGRLQGALAELDLFLRAHPNHLEALTTRGRILGKLGQPLEAVQDYTQAISLTSDPLPVLYLERAKALSAAGDKYVDEAIQSLNEGVQTLGPLVIFESLAIDLEVKRHHYDAAIARLDRVVQKMSRKERWLVRRGEILEKAGRSREALATYQDALKAIESLPSRLRQFPAVRELETHVSGLMKREKYLANY